MNDLIDPSVKSLSMQEIFDKSCSHAISQGKKSVKQKDPYPSGCAYRGLDNTSCLIGCHIPNPKYLPWFDDVKLCSSMVLYGTGVKPLSSSRYFVGALRAGGIDVKSPGILEFLHFLQRAHDSVSSTYKDDRFKMEICENLRQLADKYELTVPEEVDFWASRHPSKFFLNPLAYTP